MTSRLTQNGIEPVSILAGSLPFCATHIGIRPRETTGEVILRHNKPVEILLARTHSDVKLRLNVTIPRVYARLLKKREIEKIKRTLDANLSLINILANEHMGLRDYQQMGALNEPFFDHAEPVTFTLDMNAHIRPDTVDDWLTSLAVEPVMALMEEFIAPRAAERFAKRRRYRTERTDAITAARTVEELSAAVFEDPAFTTHDNVLELVNGEGLPTLD